MPQTKDGILSPREARLLRALAEGKTYAQAAKLAGYTAKHAASAGFQAFQQVKEKAPDIMNRLGLGTEAIIEKYLKPALEARETKFATFEGKFTDQVEVVNLSARNDAIHMAARINGMYDADKSDDGANVAVNITINGDGSFDLA